MHTLKLHLFVLMFILSAKVSFFSGLGCSWRHVSNRWHFIIQTNKDFDIQHIDSGTTWPPFSKRQCQDDFCEWKCMNFDLLYIELCPRGPINNILAMVQIMAWRRAIIWTNDGWFTDAYLRIPVSFTSSTCMQLKSYTTASNIPIQMTYLLIKALFNSYTVVSPPLCL